MLINQCTASRLKAGSEDLEGLSVLFSDNNNSRYTYTWGTSKGHEWRRRLGDGGNARLHIQVDFYDLYSHLMG
jgi:hypothetical protein